MKEKRTAILMLILLIVLAGYITRPYIEGYYQKAEFMAKTPTPLSGKNEIKDITITKDENGFHFAKIKYFYRGDGYRAFMNVKALNTSQQEANQYVYPTNLERGEHELSVEVQRAWNTTDEVVTRQILVNMTVGAAKADEKILDYAIEWPDIQTYYQKKEMLKKTTDQLYREAVTLIDNGSDDSITAAKRSLEALLLKDSKYILAYPELARVAMKSNWGPEGLKQAESYLNTGLQLDPNNANVNVNVLLGYVYVHQKRYEEAEAKFTNAEKVGTKNLWLWTNWGQSLDHQKKPQLAKEKYLVAINSPKAYDSHDRAKIEAYRLLGLLLEKEKNYSELDVIYKKRAEEFEKYSCYYADYGQLRLTRFGDFNGGIENAKRAIDKGCSSDEARYILGMAYYTAWHNLAGSEKESALSQAGIFLPAGPQMLYELARYDETSKIIPALLKNGTSLKTEDNQKYNALAYALYADNSEAVERLVKYGAKFEDPITQYQFPVGLVAFERENLRAIKLMKNKGVNFSALKFNGMSAIDYARKLNNKDIIDVVEGGRMYPM